MNTDLQTQVNVGLTSSTGFELAQRAAKLLSSSSLVPKEYQGPAGIPNCVIALNMAHRMGADPLMVMQNLVIVHGRPTWSSQFLIATFNSCGRFSPMSFEFFGDESSDEYGCRAIATRNATGEKLKGTGVTISIAKAEGWYGRNGSKWKTMPEQMLRYRAASWFVRTIAPELSMGLHTAEEVIDITDYQEIKPATPRRVKSVNDIISAEYPPHEPKPPEVEEAALVVDVDPETGEIFNNPIPSLDPAPQPAPAPGEVGDMTDWQSAIDACNSISDISRTLREMPKHIKEDPTMYAYIKDRQRQINGSKE